MPEQVHGHEVMKMMMDDGRTYTMASLRAAIDDRFGAGARFYTCAAENLTADELLAFLDGRSKFVHDGEGFRTEADRMCED